MQQIFISHSAKDRKGVEFFSKVFSGTKVRAVFEEFERLIGLSINSKQIQADINNSNCIFILLDENVENIKHTRDWVSWECGYGSQNNRDVWVFEKQEDYEKISIVTPSLKHYVLYNPTDDWFPYVRAIVDSYDNSNVLTTTLATTAIGGAITDKADKAAGIVFGALAGLALSKNNPRPTGLTIKCIYCDSIYNIHIPPEMPFRCPVCNKKLQLIY